MTTRRVMSTTATTAATAPVNVALRVSPVSGPPWTVLNVSSGSCDDTGAPVGGTVVGVSLTTADRQMVLGVIQIPPRTDGSWAATLTVAANAVPSNGYLVNAACVHGGAEVIIEYQSAAFRVTSLPVTD